MIKKKHAVMNKKSVLSVMSTALAATVVLAGCGADENTAKPDNTTPAPADNVQSEGYKLPIVSDGSVTLTVATRDFDPPYSYTKGFPVWQEVEKRTGVKINWQVTPNDQYGDVMKVKLAAGKDLPDIISLPTADPVKTADDGLIIPMDDLIAKYAPNIAKFLDENPEVNGKLRSPDGKIYALSSVTSGAAYADPYGFLIRKDWLDKLGLQEPKTLDDWYNVLKAFKEKDPNGNGKADEIPLSPDLKLRGLTLFGGAKGLHLFYSSGYYPDASGKVQYEWLKPEAKELIVWLNKLYKEGLIDPEFMTRTSDSNTANITRSQVGATNRFLNGKPKFEAAMKKSGEEGVTWDMTVPPSEGNNKGFYEKYGPISGWFAISKDAKNPEVAIKFLDYIYASEEGNRLMTFGIEGKSYTMENGQPKFTEFAYNNPDGLDINAALRSLGASPTMPWIRASEGPLSLQPKAIMELDPKSAEQAKKVESYLIEANPYSLPSVEESEILARYQTEITTYVDSMLAKFVTGVEPIDWDKFTKQVQALGIDKVIDVKQKAYDRYKNKK
ncbi:putative aldouronate transport system substrate-binding protein [Paenibacillus sp. UNCCL117]|uniref:extracellular solute-binding protein n=1 Tax=unclassified Paenibacillus TaxID=185978 RepID=UPI000891F0D7|nr:MULTISPECIES: extracellular solute-binding protein [unclassified Paenibacillus]SDC66984.1 carbohydrate ABC transporter substrate-binding protein, CUT1 family [Paenibacillus sp. cl123]SFW23192.1 putative aldouronate transport system substrate-binding protein [Paenibacillus sp. UNCCL117]